MCGRDGAAATPCGRRVDVRVAVLFWASDLAVSSIDLEMSTRPHRTDLPRRAGTRGVTHRRHRPAPSSVVSSMTPGVNTYIRGLALRPGARSAVQAPRPSPLRCRAPASCQPGRTASRVIPARVRTSRSRCGSRATVGPCGGGDDPSGPPGDRWGGVDAGAPEGVVVAGDVFADDVQGHLGPVVGLGVGVEDLGPQARVGWFDGDDVPGPGQLGGQPQGGQQRARGVRTGRCRRGGRR